MKKLSSVILSLLLILVLVTATGTKSSLFAQTQENTAVVCDESEKVAWLWGLLDISLEDAPEFIYFIWPDGTQEQASLYVYDPDERIGYYRTTNNLNIVPDGWNSDEVSVEQLAQLYYECPQPIVTTDPTVTTDPSVTIEPSTTIIPSVTTEVTVSPSITITEAVTPSVEVTATIAPTEEKEHEEESVVTATPKASDPTVTPTSVPSNNNSAGSNNTVGTGGAIVSTASNPEPAMSAPSTAQVLGVNTMAKAGAFDQLVMNLSGIFGMLFTAAGSLIYAKKRKK